MASNDTSTSDGIRIALKDIDRDPPLSSTADVLQELVDLVGEAANALEVAELDIEDLQAKIAALESGADDPDNK